MLIPGKGYARLASKQGREDVTYDSLGQEIINVEKYGETCQAMQYKAEVFIILRRQVFSEGEERVLFHTWESTSRNGDGA